jgi:succinate dehydrogenase / fumarate reductase cytochrome b subunit
MHKKRPKNLDLFTISFPLPAIVSILHRISGVLLFILIPPVLLLFNYSLLSEAAFLRISNLLQCLSGKILLWLLLMPICYHFVAGVRHLLMDLHIGDDKCSGKFTARLVLVLTMVVAIYIGVWLW